MQASRLKLRGEDVDRFAEAYLESKAEEVRNSLNMRGVRNIHRYGRNGLTQIAYERASKWEDAWLMVSVLVDVEDDRTCTVALFVGGGGKGAFKMEEMPMRRILGGEDATGEAGRFVEVLEDVEEVVDSLALEVDLEWKTETERTRWLTIEKKIFDK